MRIITVAVGNKEESFIEHDFIDGVNIILSDDNNKGKTILIQSMLYAIGNIPIFPESFNYKQYYYYLKFEHNDIEFEVVRRGDSFIVRKERLLHILDSISEFKHYWSKEVFQLPSFQFQGKQHLANMDLFIQLFFVGQDSKNTSNIFNSGYYHKDDFINMLVSYSEKSMNQVSSINKKLLTDKVKTLKALRDDKMKLSKFYKSHSPATEYLSHIKDKEAFTRKISHLEEIKKDIIELRKSRNRCATKKVLWETTLKELNSLNRNIEVGELRCMDCNSTRISYKGKGANSYSFDVSTPEMRKHIISSIEEKIITLNEDISRYDYQVEEKQIELNDVMLDEDVTLENIIAYKSGFNDVREIEETIKEIDNQISKLEEELSEGARLSKEHEQNKQKFLELLLKDMNKVKLAVANMDAKKYDSIFTKRGVVMSGSEETVFYISKLLAIEKNVHHNCPIIMDSFRAEDLSTEKENRVLNLFIELNKQCILTTTLKAEEKDKYKDFSKIHIIDYTNHVTNKLLSKQCNDEFNSLLKNMNILLD